MIRRLLAFLRDRAGTVAVEFALIAPIAIVMFCGTFEVANGVIVYMKLVNAAQTVADLVSQSDNTGVTQATLNDYFIAEQQVMSPYTTAGLGLAVASVTFDPNTGNPAQDWQKTFGGAAAMTDTTTSVAGLGDPGSSVIVAQSTYTYASLLRYVLPTPISMTQRAFSRPRTVSQVTFH